MPPPQFKDLGKKAKDLFKKQYDYKNEMKVTSKAGGVKIESVGLSSKSGLVGSSKANWKDEYLGDIEVEAASSGFAKCQFKRSNVTDGVNVTVAGDAAGALSGEATYTQQSMAATAKASYNGNTGSTAVMACATIGFDAVSVGGQVDLDASGSPKDYNLGAEYATKDLVAAVVTSNKADDITVSYFQKLSGSTALGASMLVQPSSGTRLYTLGTDYALDKSTGVKVKATSTGIVGTAITHTLAEPKMKVGVSAEFNAAGDDAFKAQKFGISLAFGEF